MIQLQQKVDALLAQPNWHEERKKLRAILLASGLTEEVKWGKLCYTFQNSNVAIFYGLKAYCGIGFFKGALLKDTQGLLHRQGEHSQAVRLFRFTGVEEIDAMERQLMAYLGEAIEIEKAGLKIDFREKHELVFPQELQTKLAENADLKTAFDELTPGRQRAYVLHFSSAKQPKTRVSRIEKSVSRILAGKGMADR